MLMDILVGAEIDLFVPSFPELQEVFALTPFMVELTLGVNLGAHCLICPLAGTLGDRYGRKPIIMLGLSIFIVGSIFCTFASTYWQVLLGRFLARGRDICACSSFVSCDRRYVFYRKTTATHGDFKWRHDVSYGFSTCFR